MDNKARPARRAFVARALAAGRLITPFALPLTPPLSYWLVSPPAALKGWPLTLAVS